LTKPLTTLTKDEAWQRGKEMHRMRVQEQISLQKIGDKYGLSRERVRQILFKYERVFLRQEHFQSGDLRVVVMGDLKGLTPGRVWMVIENAGLHSYPVQTFLDRIDLREVMDFPNVGLNTIRALLDTIEQAGYDVSHLWAARNWQNYDPSQHRGKGAGGRRDAELYRLPSLYAESSAGGEGEGLPAI
jgi:hypothetical protein